MTDIIEARKEKIGERIRQCRKAAKLTQDQLAAQITILMSSDDSEDGVNQSAISAWENGTQIPPLKRLIALSEIFRCDISYLLCDYDEKKKDISDISKFTGLSSGAVNAICYMNNDGKQSALDRVICNPHFFRLLGLIYRLAQSKGKDDLAKVLNNPFGDISESYVYESVASNEATRLISDVSDELSGVVDNG